MSELSTERATQNNIVDNIKNDDIFIKGANSNNLKNVDLAIPRNKLVVVTGVSGSGKSSITMDTLFAEGQRRYVESLSSYARQFLMRMKKPEVDYIKGICPAIKHKVVFDRDLYYLRWILWIPTYTGCTMGHRKCAESN
jgi:excinuclease ABC subunit A